VYAKWDASANLRAASDNEFMTLELEC